MSMLEKCSVCGRRLRIKVTCVETGKPMCKKCCELHKEACQYHMFCWNSMQL